MGLSPKLGASLNKGQEQGHQTEETSSLRTKVGKKEQKLWVGLEAVGN